MEVEEEIKPELVPFKFNKRYDVEIPVGTMLQLKEGDIFVNEKLTYLVEKSGFYRFTGIWFWFLFP